MKKFIAILVFTSFTLFSFSQEFSLSTIGDYCEGESIIVELENYNTSDPFYCDHNISNPVEEITHIKWTVSYSGGTYQATNGASIGSIVPLSAISGNFQIELVFSPNDWFNPGSVTVKCEGYTGPNSSDLCTNNIDEEITFTPKKKFERLNTWNEDIRNPGINSYSVTDVPGATFNWSYPSSWNVTGPTNENTISFDFDGNSQSGTLSVSITGIDACQYSYLSDEDIKVSDCVAHGYTEHNFCSSQNWSTSYTNSNGYGNKFKYPRKTGDFNGDGNQDIIGFGDQNVSVGLSNGTAFSSSNWSNVFTYGVNGYTEDKYPRMIGDFNGDGKDDVIGFGHTQVAVGISSGTSFSSSSWSGASGFSYTQGFNDRNINRRLIGDFNGDGKDDIAGFGSNGTLVGISNGSNFSSSNWSGGNAFDSNNSGVTDQNKWPLKVGDFNGDGIDDVICFGENQITVGISTGSSFSNSNWGNALTYGVNGYTEDKYPRMIGDFNGDGKDDIIGFGHNAIVVGISNGSSFSFSTWLNDEEFVRANGWIMDNRDFGVGFDDDQDFNGLHKVMVIDLNNDGNDDIIGFNDNGVYVSHSNGSHFQCVDYYAVYGNNTGLNEVDYLRGVANFDNADNEPEIFATGYNNVSVMNCHNTELVADFISPNSVVNESGYSGWEVDVNEYCPTSNISIDLSQTIGENFYQYTISEFNLSNWTGNVVYQSTGQSSPAPSTLDITNDVSWNIGQLYMIKIIVGPEYKEEHLWFRVKGTNASLILNNNDYHAHVIQTGGSPTFISSKPNDSSKPSSFTKNYEFYTIYEYCDRAISFSVNPGNSECVSEFRYEIQAVNPSTMDPYGTIYQDPSGGGYTQGNTPNSDLIGVNQLLDDQYYRLLLETKDGSTTSYAARYFEKSSSYCNVIIVKKQEQNEKSEDISFDLYPNPASENITLQFNGNIDEEFIIELYDAQGRLVKTQLSSTQRNLIDLSSLESGLYFTKVVVDGKLLQKKFIKN